MRLICPNCDAEYEVDEAAIPEGGRDVQCSNCGHAWFQYPPQLEQAQAEEAALFGIDAFEPSADPSPAAGADPAPAATAGRAEPAAPGRAGAETPRRTLDESLMAILREEAEREAAARRAEAQPIEMQTEMPLAAPPPDPAVVAARRIARMKGIDPDAPPTPEPRPGSRRQLLPDVEEITSSLRPASARGDEAGFEGTGRGGFRSGFLLAVLVAAVGLASYAMAPQVRAQMPQAAPMLDAYVARVDAGRLWLDDAMRRATAAIKDMTARQ